MEWDPPRHPNGILTEYTLKYQPSKLLGEKKGKISLKKGKKCCLKIQTGYFFIAVAYIRIRSSVIPKGASNHTFQRKMTYAIES